MPLHDVVVIGAGLAGLRAAGRLASAGRDVVVVEASDRVGGRQRTDTVDGFLLDRGFQVLNPAYPAVRRWIDVDALHLRSFPVAVRVRRARTVQVLAHPLRHPDLLAATVRSRMLRPRDLAALARWAGPAIVAPRGVIGGRDATLREGWNRADLHGPVRTEVLEPFLAGVLADDAGETSDAFVRLLVRMFALGAPGLPAGGIEALPRQLAATARRLGAEIRTGHRVARLAAGRGAVEVDIVGADPITARTVVVAVGPDAVSDLIPVPRPATRGLQTWWFRTDAGAPASALLSVDGRRRGPIVNTVVMSRTAPSYAPAGHQLVQATCLLPSAATEADVRRQLGEIWEADVAGWELLRRDDVPDALPAQTAPLRVTSPARVREHVYVAGDHRDTASIQGALVSGHRVAGAILAGA
ncbi:NAD(P)/FAD-dependent oxidoreductase [Microbacterium sp. CJ88]|uniref:NAD(P)/FAD-dependent oxidoreductase n=1 Tax=Microbacterium sp. CJ88 TaxID=3445672 RepID=UPI003F6589D8